MNAPSAGFLNRVLEHRFTVLTATLVFYVFVLWPTPETSPVWDQVTRIVLSGVVLTSVYACLERRYVLVPLIGISLLALGLIWFGGERAVSGNVSIARHLSMASILAFTAFVVLADIASAPRVTRDTVMGAISAYLLIGLVFALLYSAQYIYSSEAFDLPLHATGRIEQGGSDALVRVFSYFSFVTLTTLGYGEVLPVTAGSQAAATGEAIIGQVFLAVTVARIVALQISHGARKS